MNACVGPSQVPDGPNTSEFISKCIWSTLASSGSYTSSMFSETIFVKECKEVQNSHLNCVALKHASSKTSKILIKLLKKISKKNYAQKTIKPIGQFKKNQQFGFHNKVIFSASSHFFPGGICLEGPSSNLKKQDQETWLRRTQIKIPLSSYQFPLNSI